MSRAPHQAQCVGCGAAFSPRYGKHAGFCSNACWLRYKAPLTRIHADDKTAKKFHEHRRRARKAGATVERFTAEEIFERDNWRCGLCGKKVDRRLKTPHQMAASLDHIVSLAEGGAHSRANTQCSHRICNSKKTFKSRGQLLLFG